MLPVLTSWSFVFRVHHGDGGQQEDSEADVQRPRDLSSHSDVGLHQVAFLNPGEAWKSH